MSPAPIRRIDCQVHLLGDGGSGGGGWLRMRSIVRRLMARIIVHEAGMPSSALRDGLDALLEKRLVGMVRGSSLDAVVLCGPGSSPPRRRHADA